MIKVGIVWRCQAGVTGKLVGSLTQNENMKIRFYVERGKFGFRWTDFEVLAEQSDCFVQEVVGNMQL